MSSPNESPAENLYVFEKDIPFSQSLLWKLQEQYFASRGVEAWRTTEVPHYVTNNPVIANSYAELLFALLKDQTRLRGSGNSCRQPLHICELGAGMGRFAFHLLSRLEALCETGGIPMESFRYVLTDYAESNITFWRSHPSFQRFFQRGVLDVALLDSTDFQEIHLRVCGESISPGSLEQPLAVLGNYFFDSIPQDLYRFDKDGAHLAHTSLGTTVDPNTIDPARLIEKLEIHYNFVPVRERPYREPEFQRIFEAYQRTLKDTFLFFPTVGLHCIRRLMALSKSGLMLLSADKGEHTLAELDGKETPGVVRHGSVSMNVNYHAIGSLFEEEGGRSFAPYVARGTLDIFCGLGVSRAAEHTELALAFQRHVADFGPDDFYSIIHESPEYLNQLPARSILAYLRLSLYDADFMARSLNRLIHLAPHFTRAERSVATDAVARVWKLYFSLGEPFDLAHGLGCFLYVMDEFIAAIPYFEGSLASYGPMPRTLCNLALCKIRAGHKEEARPLLSRALEIDPQNEQARQMLAEFLKPEESAAPL